MSITESITLVVTVVALMGGLFVVLKWGVGMAIDGLRGEMRAGFESVNRRLDHLDGDVQKLTEKVFGH